MRRLARQLRAEYEADRSWQEWLYEQELADEIGPRWRSVYYATAIILHERTAEVTCKIFGHELEPEEGFPFMICRRCLYEEKI